MTDKFLTEFEVRQLRDNIYGIPITNESWQKLKENWMREDQIEWLLANQPKTKRKI